MKPPVVKKRSGSSARVGKRDPKTGCAFRKALGHRLIPTPVLTGSGSTGPALGPQRPPCAISAGIHRHPVKQVGVERSEERRVGKGGGSEGMTQERREDREE